MDKNRYFQHPGLNNSSLGEFKRSPAHYKYFKDHPEEKPETKATLTGSAFHYLCFEPGKIWDYMMVLREEDRPVPNKDYRTKENKEWKDSKIAEAERLGLQLISSDEMGIAEDMYAAVENDSQALEIIRAKENEFERMDIWERDGILYKRKADIYNPYYIADVKSCENADPAYFARSIWSWEYDRQGGMYSDGERVIKDSSFFNPFYLIAVEKSPPFGVSVHELSDEVLEHGAKEYRQLGRELRECERTNSWPGYWYKYGRESANRIHLPTWMKETTN